ncbi:MAG: 6-phosphogluconolactonase [Acidobacteria bacterium]|nr:6-phosphogluconolactonase [Acidobacteriota bacterium]
MEPGVKPDVRVCRDLDELSRSAADAAARTIDAAVRATGRCALVLSGGSTPRALYGALASRLRDQIPWAHVHLFWGDERYVPACDALSNYRMAKEALLDHVPCPAANIHPIPTDAPTPDAAARDYEATLRRYFAGREAVFDLVLLGLGVEGHTASLFPGSPALAETTRWVLAVTAPAEPPERLTLTLPMLNRAASVYFLVAGTQKARALGRVLSGTADPRACPAAGVRPPQGSVIWWVDRDAARPRDPDLHKGAIQGDRLGDEQQGNANAPALDASGMPAGPIAMAEDRIGANVDDGEIANADETGRTTDAPRDELYPLD